MIRSKINLTGKISNTANLKGKLNTTTTKIFPPIENLEVTPTKEQQVFNHENSYGYDNVTVNPIPDEYIVPDGTLPITENTTYDVRKFARVTASVHPTPNLQNKEVTPTKETQTIISDNEYDGLNEVTVNPIPEQFILPMGSIDINENGRYDVREFEEAYVDVENYIPESFIEPAGTLDITENGVTNVREYEFANVNIEGKEDLANELGTYSSGLDEQETTINDIIDTLTTKTSIPEPILQDKEITITENGTQTIVADVGYDGLNKVDVNVNVEGSGESEGEKAFYPTNDTEFLEELNRCGERFMKGILMTQANRSYLTTEPVTLYTPAETHKFYFIRYRGTYFNICWIKCNVLWHINGGAIYQKYISLGDYGIFMDGRTPYYETKENQNSLNYKSENLSTIEECLEVIQGKKTTTYTTSTGFNWGASSYEGRPLCYTNLPVLDTTSTIGYMPSKGISTNETIKVIGQEV